MSEDCLYVNVFTNNPDKNAKMPVIIYIHGGGFTVGSSAACIGNALCSLHDVVLVGIQYRVNALGFFSTGKDTPLPGNIGLLDQVLSLEWTRDNIAAFGGDPENVTLLGQSAGAASVHMHITSPLSRGLFHKAISSSGSGTNLPLVKEDMSAERAQFLEALNITETDPAKIIEQLKELPAQKIVDVQFDTPGKQLFVPTVDGKFIPKHTTQLLKEKSFAPVPYITGVNFTEEGSLLTLDFEEGFADGLSRERGISLAKEELIVAGIPTNKVDQVLEALIEVYKNEYGMDKYFWSKLVSNILADNNFVVPALNTAKAHSDVGNATYVYLMSQQLRMHHDKEYGKGVKQRPDFCVADHSDDLNFTFGNAFVDAPIFNESKFSDEEKTLSKQWMSMLCNFAATGNPNTADCETWKKFDSKSQHYLSLKHPMSTESCMMQNRVDFWTKTVPEMLL
uniref:Carboxylic ester hydrolase n=1 Tax=Phallusia mammillata TaxID=59560 RepID=A0A6F9D8J5_9ASCI|nr:carboxylesterase 5A-like [Phallusia mammillata]